MTPLVSAGLRRLHRGQESSLMQLTSGGESFRALLTGASEVEIPGLTIADPRGKSVMEVLKGYGNPVITERMRVTDTGTGQIYEVTQRLNNPTDNYVWRYELVEIVAGVDS
jgi:hypothetical protein